MKSYERLVEELESEIQTEEDEEKTESFTEKPMPSLSDSQAEQLAEAILVKRYAEEHGLTTYPESEEVKADMGADTYNKRKAGLMESLMSEESKSN